MIDGGEILVSFIPQFIEVSRNDFRAKNTFCEKITGDCTWDLSIPVNMLNTLIKHQSLIFICSVLQKKVNNFFTFFGIFKNFFMGCIRKQKLGLTPNLHRRVLHPPNCIVMGHFLDFDFLQKCALIHQGMHSRTITIVFGDLETI